MAQTSEEKHEVDLPVPQQRGAQIELEVFRETPDDRRRFRSKAKARAATTALADHVEPRDKRAECRAITGRQRVVQLLVDSGGKVWVIRPRRQGVVRPHPVRPTHYFSTVWKHTHSIKT